MRRTMFDWRGAASAAAVLTVASCRGADVPGSETTGIAPMIAGPPARAELVSPSVFALRAGDSTDLVLAIRLRDESGRPSPGAVVSWEPQGLVASSRMLTDARGEASVFWHLRATSPIYRAFATAVTTKGEVRIEFRVDVAPGPIVSATVIRADSLPRRTGIVVEVGQPARFTTYGYDATNRYSTDIPAAWSSRDPSRATVDGNGVVTGRAQGAVRIEAAIPNVSVVPWGIALVVEPLRARDVAIGRGWSCALDPSGAAVCWGSPYTSRFLTRDSVSEPRIVAPTRRFTSLRASEQVVCGLSVEGSALCWNGPLLDRQPLGGVDLPAPITAGPRLTVIAPGNAHVCGLDAAGGAFCASIQPRGAPTGELTIGDLTRLAPTVPFRALASSGTRSCGAAADGVYCWDARTPNAGFTEPERVAGSVGALDVGLSGQRLCLLDDGRRARCVAADATSIGTDWAPELGGTPLTRLAVGPFTVCGITSDHRLLCAGTNVAGLLMQPPGASTPRLVDAVSPDGTGWAAVALGDYVPRPDAFSQLDAHACATTGEGRTYCWGAQTSAQLGVESEVTCASRPSPLLPCSPTPLPVPSPRAAPSNAVPR